MSSLIQQLEANILKNPITHQKQSVVEYYYDDSSSSNDTDKEANGREPIPSSKTLYTFSPQRNKSQPRNEKHGRELTYATNNTNEFTMGQPLTSRNINSIDYNGTYNNSSVISPSELRSPHLREAYSKKPTHYKSVANFQPALVSQDGKVQVRDSQEIRIETLENIIYEKLNIIDSLESKLQKKRNKENMAQPYQSPGSIAYSDATSTTHNNNHERIEHQYKEALDKKQQYKERAKKYKHLLRKRDKEIMDLVVEGKGLRNQLEKQERKQKTLKEKFQGELDSVKDDLQSQLKRQQIEHSYDTEKLKEENLDKDRKIQQQRSQIEQLRKDLDHMKRASISTQEFRVEQLSRQYEEQLQIKDDLIRQLQQEIRFHQKDITILTQKSKEHVQLNESLQLYEEELQILKDQQRQNEQHNYEREQQLKTLKSQVDQFVSEKMEHQKEILGLQDKIKALRSEHEEEIDSIEKRYQNKLMDREREITIARNELARYRDNTEDTETVGKKQLLKQEREILEQENQIKSLTLIIEELKLEVRERMGLEQRLEAKNKEIRVLVGEMDQLKEDLLGYKLNLVKKQGQSQLEADLIKLSKENKELKMEVHELRIKLDDQQYRQTKGTGKASKDVDRENQKLKENIVIQERRMADKSEKIRKLEETIETLKKEKQLLIKSEKDNSKELKRISELERYCQELYEQLSKWSKLDQQSQLLVNKIDKNQTANKTLETADSQKKLILIE